MVHVDGVKQVPLTSICLTKNLQCKRHRDTNNEGPSVARALGQYEGGELAYFHDDPLRNMDKLSSEDACLLDTKKHFVVFDGKLHKRRNGLSIYLQ